MSDAVGEQMVTDTVSQLSSPTSCLYTNREPGDPGAINSPGSIQVDVVQFDFPITRQPDDESVPGLGEDAFWFSVQGTFPEGRLAVWPGGDEWLIVTVRTYQALDPVATKAAAVAIAQPLLAPP